MEVAVPTTENDIDAAYEDALHVLTTKPPKEVKKPDPATVQEDYYRSFRTNVLLAWTMSNVCVPTIQRFDLSDDLKTLGTPYGRNSVRSVSILCNVKLTHTFSQNGYRESSTKRLCCSC